MYAPRAVTCLAGLAVLDCYQPGGAVKGFFQCYFNRRLDILDAFLGCLPFAAPHPEEVSENAAEVICAAEAVALRLAASLEDVAEIVTLVSGALSLCARETVGILPLVSELVIFLALFRIRKHFVSLADLLEFFFSSLIARIDIRVIFACQLAESGLDFLVRSRP